MVSIIGIDFNYEYIRYTEDDNLFKVIFSYDYERFGYKAKISQSIIAYKF